MSLVAKAQVNYGLYVCYDFIIHSVLIQQYYRVYEPLGKLDSLLQANVLCFIHSDI